MKNLSTLLLSCLFLLTAFATVAATTRPLTNIQIGDTISLGNQQFIKLNDNGLLMMAATLSCPHGKRIAGQWAKCFNCPADATYDSTNVTCTCNTTGYAFDIDAGICAPSLPSDADKTNCSTPIGFLNSWHGCSALATHATVCLADPRDYRTYRVRKLADGQCWMVDSLKFGGNYGDTDGCAANSGEGNFTYTWCGGSGVTGCTAGGSNSVTKAQETFATGYYGHCRAIPGTYTDNYYNDARAYNNYLYDWVAAMQSTLAYSGSSTSFAGTQQGICPSGWHIPTGGYSSSAECWSLYNAYDGNDASFLDATKANFTLSGYVYALNGDSSSNGTLGIQGEDGLYWSSTVEDSGFAHLLDVWYEGMKDTYWGKVRGLAVRCVQD